MEEKGRKERIRELTTQKAQLLRKIHLYKIYGPSLILDKQGHTDYAITINAQLDEINTKLYLLGQ